MTRKLARAGAAFAVGLLVGAVVGLGPSCSDASCRQSCDGCCNAFGTCVPVPDNRSSSTCGLKGASCVDCAGSGQLCELSTLSCVAPTDAGVGFCGCSLPNGACAAGTTEANCGADAGACMTCDAGLTCSAGACVWGASPKQVGAPCASSAECQATLGASGVCRLATSSGSGVYVGGYCTLPCPDGDARCPTGSTCVTLDAQYGEYDALCWDNCLLNGGDPCRAPGYRCYTVADGGGHACWISPLPPPDAGPPADKVGLPCDADVACQNPPGRGGVCMGVEIDRHWMGGYCSTASCSSDAECSTDGGAVCASVFAEAPRCLRRCEATPHGDALDGGAHDGGAHDGGAHDGGALDGGALDGGALDGGALDGGALDGGAHDGGALDGGALDGGSPDGAPDIGQGSCRSGYICQVAVLLDGGSLASGVCAPGLPPPPERTGAACVAPSDCLVPRETVATCLPETWPFDGGEVPTGYPEGLCTRLQCHDDSDCAPDGGGVCHWADDVAVSACFEACEMGAPSCRVGYVCRAARSLDGGVRARSFCSPRCDARGRVCPGSQSCDLDAGICR